MRVNSGLAGRIAQEREDGCQRPNCVAMREHVDWIERAVRLKAKRTSIAIGSAIERLPMGLARAKEDGYQRPNDSAGTECSDWIERAVRLRVTISLTVIDYAWQNWLRWFLYAPGYLILIRA